MGRTWDKLLGETERFALRLSLESDPHSGTAATEEEAASWGSFQIWVRGKNICLHNELSESVESVHWYLLPLLEWLVANWDPLFHEERLPVRNRGQDAIESLDATRFAPVSLSQTAAREWEQQWQDWWLRHNIQAARSGGVFPDLAIRRWRDEIEFSWGEPFTPGLPEDMTFSVPSGMTRLPPSEVIDSCHGVIGEAIDVLRQRLPSSQRLAVLRAEFDSLSNASRTDLRLGYLAGLGQGAQDAAQAWRGLRDRFANLPDDARSALMGMDPRPLFVQDPPAAVLMFGGMAPEVAPNDIEQILHLFQQAATDVDRPSIYWQLVSHEELDVTGGGIWAQGEELAEDIFAELGAELTDGIYLDIAAQLDRIGVGRADIKLVDAAIRGLSLAGPHLRPIVAINTGYRWKTGEVSRFTYAHELCHILFDGTRAKRVAVASGPWAPVDVERRANAFAARFLVRPEAVSRLMTQHVLTEADGIRKAAKSIGVSASVFLETLHNMEYLEGADYERLKPVFHWSRLSARN